jgi:hypothetical protein
VSAEPGTAFEGERDSRERNAEDDLRALRDQAIATGRRVASFVRAHPAEMAAVAAGMGFLLGGGVARRTGTLLLGVGSRFAAARIGEWISQQSAAGRASGGQERGSQWNKDPMYEFKNMGGTRS